MTVENQTVQKVLKVIGILGILLSVYVLILAINALKENRYIGGGVPSSNVITVSGEGEVTATPDTARFSFTVTEERKTAEEAQTVAAEKINAAIAFLKDKGIEERDIKTEGFNVYPRYEYLPVTEPMRDIVPGSGSGVSYPYPGEGRQVEAGVQVSQTVSVKVRDTEKAGELLAGITGLGIKNVSGVTLTIDDETGLQREARQEAIENAREKADQLADDLDVRLVRIVSFSESGGPWYPMYRGAEMDSAASDAPKVIPQIPTGENTITSHVTITYEIR